MRTTTNEILANVLRSQDGSRMAEVYRLTYEDGTIHFQSRAYEQVPEGVDETATYHLAVESARAWIDKVDN
jgi:hypothetical protein